MTKITADHLARGAFIYIRQSTADQLLHNQESQRRQYGLADRASSSAGPPSRSSMTISVARVAASLGRASSVCWQLSARGASVPCLRSTSRLARNGRDWHTLIEFCGLVGTVLVDEDGIDDPRHPNDRLLLGMKGT